MPSRFKAILFDLGNVVIHIDFRRVLASWSRASGVSADDLARRFVAEEVYEQHERGEVSGEEYHRHLNRMLEMEISFEHFVVGWNEVLGEVVAETAEFLRDADGKIGLYAFTNSNELHRTVWSERYKETLSHFQKVYCSSQLGMRKPEPEAFRAILKDMGVEASQVVFLDDLKENIEAARALGLTTIHFQESRAAIAELRRLTGI